jgi:ADP-ribose pyrophosphatase
MYLFLCEDLEPGPADQQPDEDLETLVVPWAEALAMVEDGRIEDAKSMLALTICDRFGGR